MKKHKKTEAITIAMILTYFAPIFNMLVILFFISGIILVKALGIQIEAHIERLLKALYGFGTIILVIWFIDQIAQFFLRWRLKPTKETDSAIALSFGRCDFDPAKLVETLQPMLKEADKIVLYQLNLDREEIGTHCQQARISHNMMKMLELKGFDAGKSNMEIARAVIKLSNRQNVPIVAQWEVTFAIYKIDSNLYQGLSKNGKLVTLWPKVNYQSTWSMLEEAIYQTSIHRCSHPVLVSQRHLLFRALAVCWRQKSRPTLLGVKAAYDYHSVTSGTNSVLLWVFREPFDRIYHLFRPWISFYPRKDE